MIGSLERADRQGDLENIEKLALLEQEILSRSETAMPMTQRR